MVLICIDSNESSMKSAIALCFLILFCTVDATILNILLRQVQNTIRDVKSTVQQLERIRDNVQKDVQLTVMKKWLQQLEEYNNYVDPILDTIRKEVEDAKAKGKNAQPCYDAACNTLIYLDYIASTNARQCQEFAKKCINDNLGSIDRLITIGRELIEELNNIFPYCYEQNSKLANTLKLRSCITNQLGINKIGVKNLKTDASSAKSIAENASNIVLRQSTDCLNNAYMIACSQVAEVKSAATRCLNLV